MFIKILFFLLLGSRRQQQNQRVVKVFLFALVRQVGAQEQQDGGAEERKREEKGQNGKFLVFLLIQWPNFHSFQVLFTSSNFIAEVSFGMLNNLSMYVVYW